MPANIFAGARRLALVSWCVVLLLGVYVSEADSPYLARMDRSLSPESGCLSPAQVVTEQIQTPNGHTAILSVCYDLATNRFNDVLARSILRTLADTVDLRALDQEAAAQRWDRRRESGLFVLAASAALFAATSAIGWVVRGFLGIPRGMDRRPPDRDPPTSTEGAP